MVTAIATAATRPAAIARCRPDCGQPAMGLVLMVPAPTVARTALRPLANGLAVDRRRSAPRLVPGGEHEQELVQLLSLLGVERREELVLQAPGERAQLPERALAVSC